jgi:hypothetical protein
VVLFRVVHMRSVEKEDAFEEHSFRTPRFSPASIIPPTLHNRNSFLYHVRCRYRPIQGAPSVKISIPGFNSRANAESKTSHTHRGPIRNGSGVLRF